MCMCVSSLVKGQREKETHRERATERERNLCCQCQNETQLVALGTTFWMFLEYTLSLRDDISPKSTKKMTATVIYQVLHSACMTVSERM